MNKEDCRAHIKLSLSNLTKDDLLRKSKDLSDNLVKILPDIITDMKVGTQLMIGVFSPLQSEPRWFESFTEANELNFAMVHIEKANTLAFYEMSLNEAKSAHKLRIEKEFLYKPCEPDIILVPGLAFTKSMERLGRGGGYFDRYLTEFSGIAIGVCFETQIMDEFETNEFDRKMNIVITDKYIYKERK